MVVLDGDHLSIEDVISVATGSGTVSLAPQSIEKMLRSRVVVERLAAGEAAVYGVNTGVGLLADVRVPPADLEQLQRNVIRSHAAGVGDPLARDEVRAMMLIRANVLAKGFSGIRPVVAERLCQMLEHGVTPVVPSQGSVGASGDLAPLAHMALVLMGEGEAEYRDKRMPGREALRLAGIEPLALASKEGISLVNGTQAMLAVGCLELAAAGVLIETAEVVCAMALDALRGTPRAFDERLHAVRPHPGQRTSAEHLSRLLEGSEIRASHISCRRVQDAYSLRCAPQVHGASRDVIAFARQVVERELASVTDNPVVLAERGEVASTGNFHGQPLAFAADFCAIALADLAARNGWNLMSNAAHPGFTRTNLQTAGAGLGRQAPKRTPFNGFGLLPSDFILLPSQEVGPGTEPLLYAAADPGAVNGGYYGPSQWFGLVGPTTKARPPRRARDAATAARLWAEAERLTGAALPAGASPSSQR